MSKTPIPVTVLTGFLGSGKTTLLNRILTAQHGKKIAVIENEFGEVGIDHQLVIQADEEIFSMNNGCICCTVRGDLIRILNRLSKREERLDAVLIETTGLADPGPVAQTFFTDAEVREAYRLDAIVTLVDARHIDERLDDSDEACKQIAFADVILLNKTDLVSTVELDVLEKRLRRMNSAAKYHRAQHADVSLECVLGLGGFNLSRASEMDPQFLEPEYPFEWGGMYQLSAGTSYLTLAAGPDPEMDFVILPVRGIDKTERVDVSEAAALQFSNDAILVYPGDSIEAGGELRRLVLPGETNLFSIRIKEGGLYALFTQHHPAEFKTRFTNASAIAHELCWSQAFKPDHEHDEAVTSVGISMPGDLDGRKFNDWLAELLRTKGKDIFRSKGVLAVRGSDKRLVFQGVHMLFDGRFDRPWGSAESRQNSFVFIGRNLDRAELREGFESCLAN